MAVETEEGGTDRCSIEGCKAGCRKGGIGGERVADQSEELACGLQRSKVDEVKT